MAELDLGGAAQVHGEKVQVGSREFGACGRQFGEGEVPVELGRALVAVGTCSALPGTPGRAGPLAGSAEAQCNGCFRAPTRDIRVGRALSAPQGPFNPQVRKSSRD